MRLYTAEELIKKYKGKFINTYPHHYEKMDDKTHAWITTYEVRGVSATIRENYNLPEKEVIQ